MILICSVRKTLPEFFHHLVLAESDSEKIITQTQLSLRNSEDSKV